MRMPWQRTENRETSYTDTLVGLIVAQAKGETAMVTATAALEIASGAVARAFAAAEVQGPPAVQAALGPGLLSMIGRALIRRGEIVLAVSTDNGMALRLHPAADHDVTGMYKTDDWLYTVNLAGPSEQASRTVPAADVIHVMFERDPERPWRGISPIESASLSGRLSAELVKALGDEAACVRGCLLPVPVDGADPTVTQLRADLKNLNGQVALVESQSGAWGTDVRATAASGGWEPRRLGADPPGPLVQLFDRASREILAACGVTPTLFDASDSAGAREAWRQFLFGTVAPLGRILSAELSEKLGDEISLSWAELRASDLQGRSRSYKQLVESGMDATQAARLCGFESL